MKIIGIAGKKRSGKSSFAEALYTQHREVDIVSFADPVYAAVEAIIGPIEDDKKEEPIQWLAGITPRRLLQTLGTEWGRQTLHPDFWIMCMHKRLSALRELEYDGLVIIPDVRFENEAALIRSMDGVIVHVVREGLASEDSHESEKGIKVKSSDFTAYNTSTLQAWADIAERIYDIVMKKEG